MHMCTHACRNNCFRHVLDSYSMKNEKMKKLCEKRKAGLKKSEAEEEREAESDIREERERERERCGKVKKKTKTKREIRSRYEKTTYMYTYLVRRSKK